MALILSKKYAGVHQYKRFIRNRVLKIYPMYFFVLILSLLFSLFWMSLGLSSPIEILFKDIASLHPLTIYYLILENIFILTSDLGSFLSIDSSGLLQYTPHASSPFPFIYLHSLIPQAWTLSIELAFYAVAPFLIKRKLWILLMLAFLSLLLRLYIYSLGYHHEPWINKFPLTELVFFLIGIFSYRVYISNSLAKLTPKIFMAVYFLFLILTIFYDTLPKVLDLPINPLQWGYFFLLAILMPYAFKHFKDNKFDRFIGDLSYPVYISHIFIIYLVRNANLFTDHNLNGVTSIVITLLFSISLLWLFETFIERLRT